MPKTKSSYQITAVDILGVVNQLNFTLARIADRLDKLEGLRGELETQSGTFEGDVITTADVLVKDKDGNKLHSLE